MSCQAHGTDGILMLLIYRHEYIVRFVRFQTDASCLPLACRQRLHRTWQQSGYWRSDIDWFFKVNAQSTLMVVSGRHSIHPIQGESLIYCSRHTWQFLLEENSIPHPHPTPKKFNETGIMAEKQNCRISGSKRSMQCYILTYSRLKHGLSPCTRQNTSPLPQPRCVPSNTVSQSATVSVCPLCCT